MRLIPCDRTQMNAGYQQTKNYEVLMEFANSAIDCAKLEGWEHSTAYSCAHSLSQSIKHFKIGGIKCMAKRGEVYLVKTT